MRTVESQREGIPNFKNGMESAFGDLQLSKLDTFEIQIWLNGLAEKGYSGAVVRQCFNNIRVITKLAKKQRYLSEYPAEDIKMPQTNRLKSR